jgi:hypothetical protein
MLHEIASGINRLKRRLYFDVVVLSGNAENGWQVTNCNKTFGIGSLLLTHGKTITLPSIRTFTGPPRGSPKTIPSWNGNQ